MTRSAPALLLVFIGACAYNPPLPDRGTSRNRQPTGGQPQVTTVWEDGGAGQDAGPGVLDAGAPQIDAGAPDAGAPDAGPGAVDCAQFNAIGYEVCGSFADACEIIFRDRSGCNAACARAGLVCEDSWNDESGLCAPRRSQHYGCRESGHDSDYCVCVRAR